MSSPDQTLHKLYICPTQNVRPFSLCLSLQWHSEGQGCTGVQCSLAASNSGLAKGSAPNRLPHVDASVVNSELHRNAWFRGLVLMVRRGVVREHCAAWWARAHPWMSMPPSCGARRSSRPPPSSDRSAAFCRAAHPARRATSAARAGTPVRPRSHRSLRCRYERVFAFRVLHCFECYAWGFHGFHL
jgi:hypothetical protein